MIADHKVNFDRRWEGPHGIGRMAMEIRRRLFAGADRNSPELPRSPTSPIDPFVRGLQLALSPSSCFYSPGFNPPIWGRRRAVFTVCDLIHLRVDGESSIMKRLYYEALVKPAISDCFKVLTISEYSRRDILEWSGAAESQIVNVGCGVDPMFFEQVTPWQPGFPYFLYVGARKPHKNLTRLLEAYARSKAMQSVRLVLSGVEEPTLMQQAHALGIASKLVFAGRIPDERLPAYYRGAVALLFPSYFEGFGLPPVEAMAGGIPALTSNVTSLPEAVGDAALTVDPFSIEALQDGIDRLTFDVELRTRLIAAGPEQARRHSWDQVAEKVSVVIRDLTASLKN